MSQARKKFVPSLTGFNKKVWWLGLWRAIFLIILFGLLPRHLLAIDFRKGDNVVIPTDETITDDLILFAGNIKSSGTVKGDLVSFASSIIIVGPVDGSVMSAGRSVQLDGEIKGSARLAGQTLQITKPIGKNLLAMGQTLHIGPDVVIGNDVYFAGQEAIIDGKILGNLVVTGGRVAVHGYVGKNLRVKAEKITLLPTAVIEGDFKYKSKKPAKIEPGARIKGETKWFVPRPKKRDGFFTTKNLFWKFVFYVAMILVGCVLIALLRQPVLTVKQKAVKLFLKSFGIGLLALVAVLIGGLLCMITVVGLPLAFIIFVLTLVCVYTTKIFIGLALGEALIRLFKKNGSISPYWALILGVFAVTIAVNIPYFGWLAYFVIVFTGFGAILLTLKPALSGKAQPSPQPPV